MSNIGRSLVRDECEDCGGRVESMLRPGRCVNEYCNGEMKPREYVPAEHLRGAVANRDEALALLSDFVHGEPDVASHVARRAKALALLARTGGQ